MQAHALRPGVPPGGPAVSSWERAYERRTCCGMRGQHCTDAVLRAEYASATHHSAPQCAPAVQSWCASCSSCGVRWQIARTTGAWMLATRQQQNWTKPAHVAPAMENRSCVGIAPGRADNARQAMNMQSFVTGSDKHLALVETRRSAPSVEMLKSTDTKHEHATSPARPMSRCGACSHKLPHGRWRCGLLTSDVAKSHNHGRPCLVGCWHRRKAVAASGRTQLCCERHAHK